jgi:glycosyltransferase involved in cell wall biosynthesis
MKRLLIADGYFQWPPGGGGIRDIAEVANGLCAEFEVILLAPRFGFRGFIGYRKGLNFDVETLPFDKASFNAPNVLRSFRRAIRKIGPDLILVGNGNDMKPSMMIASRGYRTYVRLYSYELLCPISHGLLFKNDGICESCYLFDGIGCAICAFSHPRRTHYDREPFRAFTPFVPVYRRYIRESLEIPEAFILTSRYMDRRYSEIIEPGRRTMIPSGLDTSRFIPGDADRELIRIFSAGRVSDPTKGIDKLVEACELLWNGRKDFRLLLAGHEMPRGAYEFVESLGWVSENKLPSIYASSDIVVVPSTWAEPFGMVALEGMGSGKPVIASRVGGLVDFVAHGKNGLLFSPGSVKELAEALELLMDSPTLRRRMGRAARSTANRYDWKEIIPMYLDLLS